MKLKYITGILALLLLTVGTASAEEVAIDFDGDGLAVGQSIGDAYADYGVTFVGAKVVYAGLGGNLGFTPIGDSCKISFSPYVTSVTIDFKDDAATGSMDGLLVNGEEISDSKFTCFWIERTLHIESSNQNPIKSVQLYGKEYTCLCTKITFDNLSYNQIPEFPTVALPIAAILGLMFVFGRKKQE